MTIPCGHCSECKKKKASDWATRGFYEFMDCMNKGGYAYFETLTYSDEFIPLTGDRNEWISKGMNNNDSVDNFAHFDHDHIHGFFARLRKKLKDSGYDVKNKLRYFIAGEYGGKTHRPHYHLILYVYDSNLLPRDLDLYIRYAWRI